MMREAEEKKKCMLLGGLIVGSVYAFRAIQVECVSSCPRPLA